ncbi:MAG: aspartate 1-decarboxylase [Thermodesulfobacteria bacterium]|nr:aspartate 1-decarboxylase [Thermodesulfobacteriota bacterium]
MLRKFLKAKIHTVRVTDKNLDYEGSLTLDPRFMIAADIEPFESIWVYNLENGERFETYVIKGEWGSKEVCLNGAAARKGEIGDRLILVTYAWLTPEEIARAEVKVVYVDEENNIVDERSYLVRD